MKALVKMSDKITLEIEERYDMETLNKAIVLSNPPRKCSICGSTSIVYDSNKDAEGHVYVNAKCLAQGCYAKAKLGRYKSGGFFWHNNFEKYVKNNDVPNSEIF